MQRVGKLKGFFRMDAPLSKRLKSLLGFLGNAGPEEEARLFKEHSDEVYDLVLALIAKFSQDFSLRKSVDMEQTLTVLHLMSKLIDGIPARLEQKWRFESLLDLVQMLLLYDNVMPVRKKGLHLLLKLIDGQCAADIAALEPRAQAILAGAVNFLPAADLGDDADSTRQRFEKLEIHSEDDLSFTKRDKSGSQTLDETLILFNDILNYVLGTKEDRFRNWNALLQHILFPQLYPRAFPKSGYVGFDMTCPAPFQAGVVSYIVKCLQAPLSDGFWATTTSYSFVMEAFSQAMCLSGAHVKTTNDVIKTYKVWVKQDHQGTPLASNEQEMLQTMIKSLLPCFDVASEVDLVEDANMTDFTRRKFVVCGKAMDLYRLVAEEGFIMMDRDTWNVLLEALVHLCRIIGQTSIGRTNEALDSFKKKYIDSVFSCFLLHKESSIVDWQKLHEELKVWYNWRPLTEHWAGKLHQFTHEFIEDCVQEGKQIEWDYIDAVERRSQHRKQRVGDQIISKFKRWDHFIHLLGNPNELEADMRKSVFRGILKSLTMFLDRIEIPLVLSKSQKLAATGLRKSNCSPRQCLPRGNTLLYIYGPWLFDGCGHYDPWFADTKAEIYAALCRVFQVRFDEQWKERNISIFYTLLHQGLRYGEPAVQACIMRACSTITSIDLPGFSILFSDFFSYITSVLSGKKDVSGESTRLACIAFMSSAMVLPSYYGDATNLPHLRDSIVAPTETVHADPVVNKYADIRHICIESILNCIEYDESDKIKSKCIWVFLVYVCNEIGTNGLTAKTLSRYIGLLFSTCLTGSTYEVCHAAIESLRVFASLYEPLRLSFANEVDQLLAGLTENGSTMAAAFSPSDSMRCKCLAEFVFCLLEWVMVLPIDVFTDHQRPLHVFKVLELCAAFQEGSGTNPVLEAANIAHIHILNHVHNFPSPLGADHSSSMLTELVDTDQDTDALLTDKSAHIYLVYRESTLLSLHECVERDHFDEERRFVRLIIRDQSGKYAWDFRSVTLPEIVSHLFTPEARKRRVEGSFNDFVRSNFHKGLSACSGSENIRGSIDESQSSRVARSIPSQDIFSSIVAAIESNYEEGVWIQPLPEQGADQSEEYSDMLEQIRSICDQEKEALPLDDNDDSFNKEAQDNIINEFDLCRLLLSHLSFLSPDADAETDIRPLENGDRLQRSIKLLDQVHARECHKLGVIYVASGQETQKAILMNETGSQDYEQLVEGLGWTIEMNTHSGFTGGLDPKYNTGLFANYWANSTTEVIYHVASRMPTNFNDPQQIHKKRQVGNDHVHVVYSDHSCDYHPSTISSSFNDAHLILYPLTRRPGLYRVQIFSKEKVAPFGPLQDGMIVPRHSLPALVRLTAVNANRAVRYNTSGYTHPYPARRKYIDEIVQRHGGKSSKRDLLCLFFPTGSEPRLTSTSELIS